MRAYASLDGVETSPGGRGECTTTSSFSHDGWGVLAVAAVPMLIALVPVLVRLRAVAVYSAVLLWAVCLAGITSIGLFFVPAAVLLTVAAARRPAAAPTLG